jgi:CTP:molybdopterin cytidylyltransferase MocA
LFSAEFRDILLAHKGEGCKGLVSKYPQCVREVNMENDNLLRDIDTPEDYKLVTGNK